MAMNKLDLQLRVIELEKELKKSNEGELRVRKYLSEFLGEGNNPPLEWPQIYFYLGKQL